ncbi:hypothetical protein [Phormidium nigroviride]
MVGTYKFWVKNLVNGVMVQVRQGIRDRPYNLTGLVAQVNRALDDANELCRLLYSYGLLCD